MDVNTYYSELMFVFLAVEIDKKSHTDRDLFFEGKRQEALAKNLLTSAKNSSNLQKSTFILILHHSQRN